MLRTIPRVFAAALVGALAGGGALVLAFAMHADFTLEMDRDLAQITSGFYPAERDGNRTFAWTSSRASLTLPDLDRRSQWQCAVLLRGARPDGVEQAVVDFEVDGVNVARRTLTNDFEEWTVTVPVRPLAPGLSLAIASAPTFTPGHGDQRDLGVQVDRLSCRPLARLALPPARAIFGATQAGAVLGAALGLTGISAGAPLGAALLIAAAQAIPLSTGPAPYDAAYQEAASRLAVWIALLMLVAVTLLKRRKPPLSSAALFVVAFTAGTVYLKLLLLLHPSKLIIDALFHAHRLEWVLAGRYYFTQPIQSGVQFPYAIALYVVAAPWALLTRDYVSLLRIVVIAAAAIAGGCLYLMIVRTWGDKLIAALAVVLFTIVPLPYVVIGNANLTNAFGESASLVAVSVATIWAFASRQKLQVLVLALLIALALLSHVSTFTLLSVTLGALVLLYRLMGDHALRAPAWSISTATATALVFSVVIYYGHFPEAYQTLRSVRGEAAAVAPVPTPDTGTPSGENRPTRDGDVPVRLSARAANAVSLTVLALGWPMIILAIVGSWRLRVIGARDRLGLAILAWGVAFVTFALVGVLTPVDVRYARYAEWFIARAVYATYPAAVILAALGGAWALRKPGAPRLASVALLIWAAIRGVQEWTAWLS